MHVGLRRVRDFIVDDVSDTVDIEGIAHVVNFEVPDTPEAYVHRVGRTGRAESTGSALTLVAPEEVRALRALEKAVGVQLQ